MKNLHEIPGFPGYRITRYGRVFKEIHNPRVKNFPIRELTVYVGKYGYKIVSIAGSQRSIHKLLTLTFIGPQPSEKHIVRHLNGNRLDNRLNNLRWGTYQDNSNDAIRHGTTLKGEKNKKAKVTQVDVLSIRSLCGSGVDRDELARQFGICTSSVSNIVRRRTWAHI